MTWHRILRVAALLPIQLFGQVPADRFAALPAQSEAVDRGIDVKALEAKYPGQDAVFLERIVEFENVLGNGKGEGLSWDLMHTEYTKRVVFNPEDQDYSTLTITVPKDQELARVALSIRNPDGGYRQFGPASLEESHDSDGTANYKFAFPEVTRGSVITEAYTIRRLYCVRNMPLFYGIPLQYRIPCEKASFRILYPEDWNLEVKKLANGASLPVTLTRDRKSARTLMSCHVENMEAVPYEPFSPFHREVALYAEVRVLDLSLKSSDYRPFYYKAARNWGEVSKAMQAFAVHREALFSSRVEDMTRAIAGGYLTDIEKLDAIITWLQENMRNVGYADLRARGLEDGNFADILKRREGTVEQITGLALCMLRIMKIDARYVLLHSAKDGHFDPGFYSYNQIGDDALLCRIVDRTFLVFPCRWHMPVDFVPEEYQGQAGLAFDPKGKPELVQIAMGSPSANETAETYHLAFQEDGRIRVQEERVLSGAAAYTTRLELEGLNAQRTENALKRMLTFSEGKPNLVSHAVEGLEAHRQPLKIKLEYDLENLVSVTPDEVIFQTGGLFRPLSKIQAKDSAKDRQNPVRIYFDETVKKTITLAFPASWTPTTPLGDFSFENRFGTLHGTYHAGPGSLSGERVLVLKTAAEPRTAYPELLALTGRKSAYSLPAIVFKVRH